MLNSWNDVNGDIEIGCNNDRVIDVFLVYRDCVVRSVIVYVVLVRFCFVMMMFLFIIVGLLLVVYVLGIGSEVM